MPIQIQYRRGTAAEWTAANTLLAIGEPGYETDTGKFKVGDGSTSWNSLGYSSGPAAPILPTFSLQGTAYVLTGKQRYYFESGGLITKIRVSAGTPSTGSGLTARVNLNGTSLSTVTVPATSYTNTATLSQAVVAGDYLTIDITAVGSTTAGGDITIEISVQQ